MEAGLQEKMTDEAACRFGSSDEFTIMDLEIIWDLFTNCIEAAKILGIDEDFRAELERARSRLAPLQIGKHGQL